MGLSGRKAHINLKRKKALACSEGAGRWSPDKARGREGREREFLRVWSVGQSRQEEMEGGGNAGDEDPAGQLDNSDIQLGR